MRTAQAFVVVAPDGIRLLTVQIAPDAGGLIVRTVGEVDAFTGHALDDALAAALAMEPARLTVDLTAVSYFSVSSVAILFRARRQASACAAELEVVTRPGIVQRVVAYLDWPALAA